MRSNHALKVGLFILIGLLVISWIVLVSIDRVGLQAQEDNSNMQTVLQQLVENSTTFVIVFREPIASDVSGWILPGDILDGSNIVGRRLVKEIGSDYICINQIGQGSTDVYCSPYTNILYLTYPAGNELQ